jgi:mRNA-degrading endonuclease RelE of RelBE toxin-antitoxin system
LGYIVEIIQKGEKEFFKLPPTEQKKIRNKILSLEKIHDRSVQKN